MYSSTCCYDNYGTLVPSNVGPVCRHVADLAYRCLINYKEYPPAGQPADGRMTDSHAREEWDRHSIALTLARQRVSKGQPGPTRSSRVNSKGLIHRYSHAFCLFP